MKKILFAIFLLNVFFSFGQNSLNNNDTIRMELIVNRWYFYKGEQKLKNKEVRKELKSFETSKKYYNKSELNEAIGFIINYTGGYLIGWQLARLMLSGEFNFLAVGIGGGLIISSIPFYKAAKKNLLKSISEYNKQIKNP